MSAPYPQKFREDASRVAGDRGPGVQLKAAAGDSGYRTPRIQHGHYACLEHVI